MNCRCPQCNLQLPRFSVACDQCGWTLIHPDAPPVGADGNLDRVFERVRKLIDQANYTTALGHLNHAPNDISPDRLAEFYALRGFVQLKNFDFEQAENDCTEAIQRDGEDPQLYAWRAAAHGEQDKWKSAFDDLDQASRLAGVHCDPYLELMEAYSRNASEYFRNLIQQGEESADLFFERGWVYLRSGKPEKAERDFNQALLLEPGHAWAALGLAMLKVKQNNMKGLEALCQLAIRGDTECKKSAYEIRARLHRNSGNVRKSQQDLDHLIELADRDPLATIECCQLLRELGDSINAITRINELVEVDSDQRHPLAYRVRGDCYRDIKNYALAIRDYSHYLKVFPDDAKSLIRRAAMFMAVKRYGLAQKDIAQVMKQDNIQSDAYLIQSEIFLVDEQLDQALTACQKAVRLDSQRLDAFAVLARIYYQLGNYTGAIQEYGRCVDLASSNEEKANFLYLRGVAHYHGEAFSQADSDFNESCQLRPNHSGGWVWKAAACSRLEKWTDAITGLQNAMLARPADSGEYKKLGQTIAEKAVVVFDQQQQRGNRSLRVFTQRGMAYQFLEQWDLAINDYTQFLDQSPDDSETLVRRGQARAARGDHHSANQDFSRAIGNEPRNHHARYCRAISRAALCRWDAARSDLIKAIRETSEQPHYHILLGELRRQAGAVRKSIAAFDDAILRDPTDPTSYRLRGSAHLQSDNFLDAIRDFTHSIELDPRQTKGLVLRGQAYRHAGLPVLAVEDFELALKRDPNLAMAYSGRAAILLGQQKHEYTLIWLTKAFHRFPHPGELAEIVFARGNTFYQMGRFAPAISDFTAVIELTRNTRNRVALARYARAIAYVQSEAWEKAEKDFRRLEQLNPQDGNVRLALKWLQNRSSQRPAFLISAHPVIRPTRPQVTCDGVRLVESAERWESPAPFDSWVLRNQSKTEFGPVSYSILKKWVSEGRVASGMKVLRADWSKWKRTERIFIELSPVEDRSVEQEAFPGIRLC